MTTDQIPRFDVRIIYPRFKLLEAPVEKLPFFPTERNSIMDFQPFLDVSTTSSMVSILGEPINQPASSEEAG